jgi:sugar phosphate permease
MDKTGRSARIGRVQRTALALLIAGGVVNYIDRATLAVANPLIRQDLGLSVADMGVLLSAFLWAYAFSQLPAGAIVDRVGPRLTLSLSLSIWSLAQFIGGLVTGFGQFFAARLLLGVGESPQFPTCARVVRDWFNVRGRGTATGLWNCSSTLGSAISAPLLTFLMLSFGWRPMFMIMGVLGLIVAALIYTLHRDPREVELTEPEQRYLAEGDPPPARSRPKSRLADWGRLFRFRTTWGMILGFFGCVYLTWIYNTWLPGYLEMERHFSIKGTGWIASIPFAFGVVGSILGGRFADWLVVRGVSPMNSRKYPMAASLLLTAAFTTLAAETPNDAVAVAAISVSLFLLYVCSATAWAMAPIAAPAHLTASLGSMQNFGGYLGGALAPIATGFIRQQTGSFAPALLLGAAVGVAAALIYLLLVRDIIPERTEAHVPLGEAGFSRST